MREKIIESAVNILALPIILLNWVGAIVGWIWLMFYGEWKLIGIGLLATFVSHHIIGYILMIVALPFSFLGIACFKRNWLFLAKAFGGLSSLLINGVQTAYAVLVIYLVLTFHSNNEESHILPYLLASWSLGLSPWQFLALKEEDNEFTAVSLLSFSVFYFIMLLSIYLFKDYLVWIVLLGVLIHNILIPILSVTLLRNNNS